TPYIPYEGGFYLRVIQIKYTKRELVQEVLEKTQQQFGQTSRYNLLINVDPYNF
ncbi:MAG: hypothetical protein GX813_01060, partial [Erysipelotrichia bacterium]|nr:hypothetical protein [Erysipelotrichia bacterium]